MQKRALCLRRGVKGQGLISSELYAAIAIFQFLTPKKLFGGPSPHFGTTLETPFSPVSFGKSFMKIRSAVPENGCLVFFDGRKKNPKKQKKHL